MSGSRATMEPSGVHIPAVRCSSRRDPPLHCLPANPPAQRATQYPPSSGAGMLLTRCHGRLERPEEPPNLALKLEVIVF